MSGAAANLSSHVESASCETTISYARRRSAAASAGCPPCAAPDPAEASAGGELGSGGPSRDRSSARNSKRVYSSRSRAGSGSPRARSSALTASGTAVSMVASLRDSSSTGISLRRFSPIFPATESALAISESRLWY